MTSPKITITITGADKKLSTGINESIESSKTYKYTYLKQLISRLRAIKSKVSERSETEQIDIISNVLKAERNIANYTAEQYAELGYDEVFDSLTEVVSEIEELFE